MLIGERYKITGEPLNVIVEELKEVLGTKKDENGKVVKGKDGKPIKELKTVWKVEGYCIDLEHALRVITTKELNVAITEDLKDIVAKIKELEAELPKIALKIFEGAEVIKKPQVNSKKKQKKLQIGDDEESWEDEEIDFHNDFFNEEEEY